MKWGSMRVGPHFIVLLGANGFEDIYEIGHNNYIFCQLCNFHGRLRRRSKINLP